ncbi:MAG: hypothetical protein WCA78_00695 [Rhizomicrobium sp.]
MIKSSDIITKLKTLTPDTLPFVGGAAAFAAAVDQLKVSGSAFVMPSQHIPTADRGLTGVISQKVSQKFMVMLGFTRAGATGADRVNLIEDTEQAVIGELLGWQPEGIVKPVTYAGGKLVGINVQQGIIFWGSEFTADYYLREGIS